ncbi:hypothetical protein KKF91_19405 [Myxococcota bacterium]|nr:hypothetical protein [Myxococcota bacterium]
MKIFRKKGLFFIFSMILISWVSKKYIITDDFIESYIEYKLSEQNNALVEIDNLNFDILHGKLSWDRLQITNPKDLNLNLVETGKANAKIEIWRLLQKKIIINTISFNKIVLDSKRESPGIFKKDKKGSFQKNIDLPYLKSEIKSIKSLFPEQILKIPEINLIKPSINLDEVISSLNLKSPSKIDALKNEIEDKINRSISLINRLNIDNSMEKIDNKLNSLDLKGIKNAKSARKALKTLDEINIIANKANVRATMIYKNIEKDINLVSSSFNQIDDWIKDDYDQIIHFIDLPNLNHLDLSKFLFMRNFINFIDQYLIHIKTSREMLAYLNFEDPEIINVFRASGIDVHYDNSGNNSTFWLKNSEFSYNDASYGKLSGSINNIMSNLNQENNKIRFFLNGKNKENEEIKIYAEFYSLNGNWIENINVDIFNLDLSKLKLLTGIGPLSGKFKNGRANLSLKIQMNNSLPNINVIFNAHHVKFKFRRTAKNEWNQILQNMISEVDQFKIESDIAVSSKDLNIKIRSDLDERITNKIKNSIKLEIAEIEDNVKNTIDIRLRLKRNEFNQFCLKHKENLIKLKNDIENKISLRNDEINRNKAKLDKILSNDKKRIKKSIKSKIKF